MDIHCQAYSFGLRPSMRSIPLQVTRDGAGTVHLEGSFTGIPKEGSTLPVLRASPSDSLYRTKFIGFPNVRELSQST